MQLKTILDHVQKFKSFVYGNIVWVKYDHSKTLLIEVLARKNSKPICSGCGSPGPCYDTLEPRKYEFVPLWNIPVFFMYAKRRVDCKKCGHVKAEIVPWADGKNSLTKTYMQFLSGWAKKLSWKETAVAFGATWEKVFNSAQWMVQWGLAHRDLSNVESIGVDEVLWHKGHEYLTVVYQIDSDCKRLLWVGKDRTIKTLQGFFDGFGKERSAKLFFICTDMWKPYLKVIAEKASQAIHVLDRFHIAQHMNKAIDKVRAEEARKLAAKGVYILKHSRWCLLKRPENLTDAQQVKLSDLVQFNFKTVRSYLLKEDFQFFWQYIYPNSAGKFLDDWCRKVMRSQIEPMKEVARMLRSHRELLLNWFRARKTISSGVIEGLNNKLKLNTRKSYGFRTFEATEVMLYHTLGSLPEPESTHRFC
jgi:transposase